MLYAKILLIVLVVTAIFAFNVRTDHWRNRRKTNRRKSRGRRRGMGRRTRTEMNMVRRDRRHRVFDRRNGPVTRRHHKRRESDRQQRPRH